MYSEQLVSTLKAMSELNMELQYEEHETTNDLPVLCDYLRSYCIK